MSTWTEQYYVPRPEFAPKFRCRECGEYFVFVENLIGHALSKHYKPGSEMRRWMSANQAKVESFERAEELEERDELTAESICGAIESSDRENGENNGREKIGQGCYRATRL